MFKGEVFIGEVASVRHNSRMSFLIFVSMLLRLCVLGWGIVLRRRSRDWKPSAFVALMVLLLLHDIARIITQVNASGGWPLEMTADFELLMDFGLGLLMLAIASMLDRELRSDTYAVVAPKLVAVDGSSRLIRTAVAIAVVAIVTSGGVGWLAWNSSRSAVLDTVAHESLSISRSLANQVELRLPGTDDSAGRRQRTLVELENAWNRIEPPYEGSYLCVIESSGRLTLHSKNGKMVGTDVSQVIVDPAAAQPRTVKQLLERRENLATQNMNFRGLQQLAGYSYMPSIDSLVVVHVPTRLVEENIRKTAIPWAIGLAIVAGVLIPLSVVLLHHSYAVALGTAQTATSALGESQEQFRTVCTHVPVGIFICDRDGGCIYINEYTEKILGIPPDDALGLGWTKPLHPDDRDRVATEWQAAVRDGAQFESEFRFQHEDGLEVWVFGRSTAVRDTQQNITGYVGSVLDVTQRKQAEDALRHSEERYRDFVENSGLGVYLCEFDEPMPVDLPHEDQIKRLTSGCHFALCNDDFARMYGFESGNDMIGMRAIDLYRTNENEANAEFMRVMIANGYCVTDQISEEFDRHGQSVVFSNSCRGVVKDGHLLRVWGTQLDVTDRVLAERAVQASEARHKSLVRTAPVCIHEIDLNGRLLSMNQAGLTMLGAEQESDIVGAHFLHAVCATDRERITALFEDARAGKSSQFEFTTTEATGSRSFWSSFVPISSEFPTHSSGGHVQKLMGITEDVTQRNQAAAEREKLITELEQKNAELEQFTYTVSHDLKSPLVTIGGFMGMLKRDLAEQNFEAVDDDIAEVDGAVVKMKQLLDQLLELSRAGRVISTPVEVPFGELVEEALEAVQTDGVRLDVAGNLPTLCCDRIRIREVMQNLLENAVKFSRDQPEPCVEIGVLAGDNGGSPVLFVRDNGIGIDPVYSERIFDLFEQLDASREGTGIGLALCRRIVTIHGGRIWVESDGPGTGCTFFFTLGG